MANGALRLDLGDLDLIGADGGYGSYSFSAQGEEVDFGEPQPIDVTLASLMSDGAPTETIRYENREVSFRVEIHSPDGKGLADGEKALLAQVGVRTTLKWTPPDGFGPTTVFRVETSRTKFLFNDLDEVRSTKRRTFQLTLTCLPFARSTDPVTIGAEFVADTVTISDDCESTTGWTATAQRPGNNPVAKAVDASIFATGTGSLRLAPAGTVSPSIGGQAGSTVSVAKTGLSISAAGGGYFVMRLRAEWPLLTTADYMQAHLTTTAGGRQAVVPLVGEADVNGFRRVSFAVPDTSTITGVDFLAAQVLNTTDPQPAPKLWIDSLGLAGNSSAPQNIMSFDVLGSMRCEGSFQISAPAGLGDALIYTCPDLDDGLRPDLRRRMVSGTPTLDSGAINGSRLSLGSAPTFSAPASMLRPGSYAVLARMRRTSGTTATTVTVTAQTKSGATSIGPLESLSVPGFIFNDDDYHLVRLGVLELPPLVTDPASNATVLFTMSQGGGGAYAVDELLVFPLADHALTWVKCGTGAASATVANRLWIDEPSPARPRGARLIGTDAARLDARYALPESAGRHVLKPGRMLAYLLTAAAGGADLQVTYTPAWHSNAGK